MQAPWPELIARQQYKGFLAWIQLCKCNSERFMSALVILNMKEHSKNICVQDATVFVVTINLVLV